MQSVHRKLAHFLPWIKQMIVSQLKQTLTSAAALFALGLSGCENMSAGENALIAAGLAGEAKGEEGGGGR